VDGYKARARWWRVWSARVDGDRSHDPVPRERKLNDVRGSLRYILKNLRFHFM
jgi:hypothetical protein